MLTSEYLVYLRGQVSAEEWEELRLGGEHLDINEHNLDAMLQLGSYKLATDDPEINDDLAARLEQSLWDYLDKYMTDRPNAEKWIVLACLFLALVARRPMHPIDRAGVEILHNEDGTLKYICPLKKPGESLICDCCVCEAKGK